MRDQIEFFRQFRTRFKTTGSVLPSSRFLARAMTGPMKRYEGPARILEIGPGTGAVTQRIVRLLKPEDRFDLVEINESFAELLNDRFENDHAYKRVAPQSKLHVCPLEEFESDCEYDFIISGLPLNNFSVELVQTIYDSYFRLLAPGGVLAYFEYMYIRSIRGVVSRGEERKRIQGLNSIFLPAIADHRIRRSWVFVNLPPAWVQHLQVDEKPASTEPGNSSSGK